MKTLLIMLVMLFPFAGNAMTVNVVADIHAGSSKDCGGYVCVSRWREAFQQMLDKTDGMIITVGDNMAKGSKNWKKELLIMTAGEEIYWANGNHDGKTYMKSNHYVVDKEDWRIVFQANKDGCKKKEAKWVEKQLKGFEGKKVLVVRHYPLFKVNTNTVQKDCKNIEKIYDKYNVDYVFSGHWHGDEWTKELNGVTYKAFRGLTTGGSTNYYKVKL